MAAAQLWGSLRGGGALVVGLLVGLVGLVAGALGLAGLGLHLFTVRPLLERCGGSSSPLVVGLMVLPGVLVALLPVVLGAFVGSPSPLVHQRRPLGKRQAGNLGSVLAKRAARTPAADAWASLLAAPAMQSRAGWLAGLLERDLRWEARRRQVVFSAARWLAGLDRHVQFG